MTESKNTASEQRAGLFLLKLRTDSNTPGAPVLHLSLGIDTPHQKATGMAEVTQALEQPVVCTSNVSGPISYLVFGADETIEIELTGYPYIQSTTDSSAAPTFPRNFTARLSLEKDWKSGEVSYQYQNTNGQWVKMSQPISETDSSTTVQLVAKAS